MDKDDGKDTMPQNDLIDSSQNMQITTSQPVDHAINKIEELANTLIETVHFTEGVQENFQNLAESLEELETERLRLHDELEIKTINASVKRHALRTRPPEYQKELEEAVLAARNSNAATMKSLQAQMVTASEETEKSLKRQEMLQIENARLIPECDEVTKQHDEIIAALNQRMADKASKQIKLNETRDILRETTSNVKEFDLGMKNLNEDLAIFRHESKTEETELQQDIAKTEDSIIHQNQQNTEEKRSTDQVLDRILDMEGKLDVVLKDVRRTENSKARLEMQSIQLADTVNREKMINRQTAEEVAILEAARDKQAMGFNGKIQELEVKLNQVGVEIYDVEEIHRKLEKEKDEVFLHKEEKLRLKSKHQASVREIAREVQIMKAKTTSLIEKAAHLSHENTQYQEDISTLNENHSVTMETFNAQIMEYQANLDAETVERMKAQEDREETEKVLDDFRSEQVQFMNNMTKKIEEGRRKHKSLVEQSTEYKQSVSNNKKKSKNLKIQLDLAEKGFVRMRKEMEMEIERLKTSIELYATENVKKEKYIEDKKPVLTELEADLEEVENEYSVYKNEVVTVRNKQKSVQEQINRTQVMLDRLAKPHEKLKEDIKECRISMLGQLRESAQERKLQEAEIYDRTQKLENVVEENEKFSISCEIKKDLVVDIGMDIKAHGYYQEFLVKELNELQRRFTAAWDVCIAMEKESAQQDDEILEGIKDLQMETKDRCKVLTGISDQLNSEMNVLTGFLDNVNSRRPKDTRQQQRLKPTPPVARPWRTRKSSSFVSPPSRNLQLPVSSPSYLRRISGIAHA
ncbi:uncharacterized protein LOC120326507 [Styela clava]